MDEDISQSKVVFVIKKCDSSTSVLNLFFYVLMSHWLLFIYGDSILLLIWAFLRGNNIWLLNRLSDVSFDHLNKNYNFNNF